MDAGALASLVPYESRLTKPWELVSLGLKPYWLCHCSWSALRSVWGVDDVGGVPLLRVRLTLLLN